MIVRDFQSRLAMKHGIIQRKIIDDQLSLAGAPTDTIRIRKELNYLGDIESRIVENADVIPVIWPAPKDIPIRKLGRDEGGGYTITSHVAAAENDTVKNYEIYVPHDAEIKEGDMFVRVFIDPDVKYPTIWVVKVSELLGTFNQQMLLWEKCICTLDTESLPEKITKVIGEMAERRLHINF